jgi:hypothetical protein
VARRPHPQVVVRLREAQIGEERVRHAGIVVLPGVDEDGLVTPGLEGLLNGRHLHEVRARARDHQGASPPALQWSNHVTTP